MIPRGIRNNNPGNLATNPKMKWRGELTPDGMYCVFDTPENGLRALTITLNAYYTIHQLHTIAEIITRYAPPDTNNTAAYIDTVAIAMSFPPNQQLPNLGSNHTVLCNLIMAIVQQENGQQPYPSSLFNSAIAAARI